MMTFKQFAATLDTLDTEDLIEEARRRKPKSKRRGLRRFRNISPKSIFLPTLMKMPTPRRELIQGKQGVQKPIARPVSKNAPQGVPKNAPPPSPVNKLWKTLPASRTIAPKRPQPLRGSPDEAKLLAKSPRL